MTVLAAFGAADVVTDRIEFSDVRADTERFSDLSYRKRIVDR